MDHQKARKQKSRGMTEMSRDSLNFEQEELDESVPPSVPGKIFEYLSRIINPARCSKKVLYESMIKLLKISTNSTWVEVFLLKKESLKVYGSVDIQKKISLNPEDNLVAHSINQKQPVLVTNPHTSTLYSKFPTKMQGFSVLTQQVLKLYSTACIPLSVISN